MLNVEFSKYSEKFLKRLPPKHKKQVVNKSMNLSKDPFPPDSKILEGFPGFFRTDFGEYRIIYRVSPPLLNITLIGKRNDDEVYRKFKRLFN